MNDPTLLWGSFARCLGALYLVAFASLLREVVALAGANGISPVGKQLARIRHDFPGLRRFLWFPTLLWAAHSDRALRGWLVLGLVAAASIVIGGPHTPWAFGVCWLVFLSFDLAVDLVYPWDCALFEAGFLALFLPALFTLPSLDAVAEPAPATAWAYRWLLARIVLGFGKFKFFEGGKLQSGYLTGFLIGQPIPSPLGWLGNRLPVIAFRAGLVFLFCAEVIAPVLIFVTPQTRVAAAVVIIALMAAIQLGGNFGWFNLLVAALCLPLFDTHETLLGHSPAKLFADAPVATAYACFIFFAGLIWFPFNSWVTRAWPYWRRLPRALTAVGRALTPFRLVHAYGVFGPETMPAVKWVPVIEGSADGINWEEYRYRFMPSHPDSAPRFIAPWMPRWDHFLIYEAYGIQLSNFLAPMFSTGNPYRFGRSSMLERAMQRLLEGNADVRGLFAADAPFADAPPKYVRATCCLLEPSAEGWWQRTRLHTHVEATAANPALIDAWPGGPTGFHWDDHHWRQRSPEVARLLTEREVSARAATWKTDLDAFHELALLLGHALAPMRDKWGQAPFFHPRPENGACPPLLRSDFHFYLFVLSVIGRGDAVAAFEAPERVRADFEPADGLRVLAVHYSAMLQLHARKARLMRFVMPSGNTQRPPPFVPGFIELAPEVEALFPATSDERQPEYEQAPDGRWLRLVRDSVGPSAGSSCRLPSP